MEGLMRYTWHLRVLMRTCPEGLTIVFILEGLGTLVHWGLPPLVHKGLGIVLVLVGLCAYHTCYLRVLTCICPGGSAPQTWYLSVQCWFLTEGLYALVPKGLGIQLGI